MDDLLDETQIQQLAAGEVIEATVLTVAKHEVWRPSCCERG